MIIVNMNDMKNFSTKGNKGFYIKFPNGVLLSTQFGYANYCSNYFHVPVPSIEKIANRPDCSSDDCEVAIIGPDGAWITGQYDPENHQVIGYVDIKRWLEIVEWCKNWKP